MLGSLPAGPVRVDEWMRVPHTHSSSCTRHSWLVQNHSSNWWSELGLQGRRESEGENVLQSCPILCAPMDCSLPGSSVIGILQARILEWVAIPFSRESSQPGNQAWGRNLVCCLETTKQNQCDAMCACSVASVMSNSLRPYGL